jgi:hypothetical protein
MPPAAAMSESRASDLLTAIQAALASGTTIRIVYRGGSQPGTVREIRPMRVTETEVRAYDVTAGIAKTFVLAKLALPPDGAPLVAYQAIPESVGDEPWQPLDVLMGAHLARLEALGWKVRLESNMLTVARIYTYFKNGKPRWETPLMLTYSPGLDPMANDRIRQSVIITLSLDSGRVASRTEYGQEEPEEPEEPAARRPYTLSRMGRPPRSFGRPSRAAAMFMLEIEQLGPVIVPSPPPPSTSQRKERAT